MFKFTFWQKYQVEIYVNCKEKKEYESLFKKEIVLHYALKCCRPFSRQYFGVDRQAHFY